MKLPFTESALLSKVKNLRHGFSNLQCDDQAIREFASAVATAKQVHKDALLWVNQFEKAKQEADGIGTATVGLPVGVFTADCSPILFALINANNEAIAILAVHAGWRGTAIGIAGKALAFIQHHALAQDASRIIAAIGPCISRKAFEVGPEVVAAFPGAEANGIATFLRNEGDRKKYLFDLPGESRRQLELAPQTIPLEIDQLLDCTFSEAERYPSYRRDREKAGRILSFLSITQ